MVVEGATLINGIAKYAAAGPPVINASTHSMTTQRGVPVSLAVDASGLEIQYQWQFEGEDLMDGVDIEGATTSMVTLLNPQFEDTGSYAVVVSNPCGEVASESADLIVTVPGDLNFDGRVSGDDLSIMLAFWGDCPPEGFPCDADLDGNGFVDGSDLSQLLAAWTG